MGRGVLGREVPPQDHLKGEDPVIGYRALLDVPPELVVFVAQLLRVERRDRAPGRGAGR